MKKNLLPRLIALSTVASLPASTASASTDATSTPVVEAGAAHGVPSAETETPL